MLINPDPNSIFPLSNIKSVVYLKPIIKNTNIIVGDFTYFSDDEDPLNFEKHVTHHYKFINDKLIIGKFCAINEINKIIPILTSPDLEKVKNLLKKR